MQISKKTSERQYTVAPLPDSDPELTFTVRILTDPEIAKIYDKHGYLPGGSKATMAKLLTVSKEMMKASIVGWTNFNDENGTLLDLSDKNKMLLYETEVEIDSEVTTLWQLVQAKVSEQRRAEAKN